MAINLLDLQFKIDWHERIGAEVQIVLYQCTPVWSHLPLFTLRDA